MKRFASASVVAVTALFAASCSTKQSAEVTAPLASSSVSAGLPASGIVPGSPEDFKVNVGDTVQFAYDAYNLDDQARATLEKQANWLLRYPNATLSIEGHCDERGTREYNLALGARRANAIGEHLASRGVSHDRLQTVSFGKERPICTETNDDCWKQNRRGVSVASSRDSN